MSRQPHPGSTLDFGLRDGARAESTSLVRTINEQLVLDTVLAEGRVTRSGLARRTGLSKPTISSLVQNLEDNGLVTSAGPEKAGAGRPATVYTVNRLAGHTYAVDLGGTKLRAAVTDVFGEILAEETVATPQDDAASVVEALVSMYTRLVGPAGVDGDGVAASCIGLPGVVHGGGHHIESAFNLPTMGDTDIPTEVARRTGLDVVTENDVNLAAIGERWRGKGRGTENFVAISIGTGIGMGIVLDGELYRGVRGAAGEVGFLPIGAEPYDPEVHRRGGALEASSAAGGIHRRLARLLPDHPDTTLGRDSTVRDLFTAAAEGADPLADRVIDEVAADIAAAITAVIAVLDPELVVLGGGIGSNPLLLDPVRDRVARMLSTPPRVETSALSERASLHGAIGLALHRIRRQLLATPEPDGAISPASTTGAAP